IIERVAGHRSQTIIERFETRKNVIKFDVTANERIVDGIRAWDSGEALNSIVRISPTNSFAAALHLRGADLRLRSGGRDIVHQDSSRINITQIASNCTIAIARGSAETSRGWIEGHLRPSSTRGRGAPPAVSGPPLRERTCATSVWRTIVR